MAFDKVRRETLWPMLARFGVPDELLSVIKALHCGTKARVRIGNCLSDEIDVERGVRQGCPMAPFLFNLYLYGLLLVADQESWSGAEVEQTEVVSNEFADDIVLTHDDEGKLQENLTKINTVTANEGMEISKRKTECMWLCRIVSQ